MATVGNLLSYEAVPLTLLKPTALTVGTAANGPAISEPWRTGRQLAIIASFVGATGQTSGELKLQGLRRSDGSTWDDLIEPDGSGVVRFDGSTKFATNGAYDANVAGTATAAGLGCLLLDDVKAATYSAIRVVFTATGGSGNPLVAVTGLICDTITHPVKGVTDELFKRSHYGV